MNMDMINSFLPDPNITFPEEVEEDWTEDVQHEEPTALILTEVDADVLQGNTNKSPDGPNHSTSGTRGQIWRPQMRHMIHFKVT